MVCLLAHIYSRTWLMGSDSLNSHSTCNSQQMQSVLTSCQLTLTLSEPTVTVNYFKNYCFQNIVFTFSSSLTVQTYQTCRRGMQLPRLLPQDDEPQISHIVIKGTTCWRTGDMHQLLFWCACLLPYTERQASSDISYIFNQLVRLVTVSANG